MKTRLHASASIGSCTGTGPGPASSRTTTRITTRARSACPGKVGTGFPIRTCAKSRILRLLPDRHRPAQPVAEPPARQLRWLVALGWHEDLLQHLALHRLLDDRHVAE